MPCNTVSTAKIRLSTSTVDMDSLKLALTELQKQGIYVSILNTTGADVQLQRVGGPITDDIKSKVAVGYSLQMMKKQANRFKWGFKTSMNAQGEVEFELLKGRL